jgi:cell division protein ZapA
MGQVVITVNSRNYTMECADGEEEHLRELASLLDNQVKQIKAGVGEVGDIRLLVMAGLIIADQLSEALDKVETLSNEIAQVPTRRVRRPSSNRRRPRSRPRGASRRRPSGLSRSRGWSGRARLTPDEIEAAGHHGPWEMKIPGPYKCRWAPFAPGHGPEQGQLP